MFFIIYLLCFIFSFFTHSSLVTFLFGLSLVLEGLNLREDVKVIYNLKWYKKVFRGYIATTFGKYIITHTSQLPPNTMRHELTHVKQYKKYSVIVFLGIYLANFVYNIIRYKDFKKAYREIEFEKEARRNEST